MENVDTIVRHAFCDQRSLNLIWYQKLTSLRNIALQRATSLITYSNQIKGELKADKNLVLRKIGIDPKRLQHIYHELDAEDHNIVLNSK